MVIKVLSLSEVEDAYRSFTKNQYRSLAQHTFEWQSLLDNWDGIIWKVIGLFENEDLVACIPFCLKETALAKVIMSSPLPASYGGILHVGDCVNSKYYEILLDALYEYAVKESVDVISILTSPFRDDITYYKKYFNPDYVFENFYQYVPNKDNELKNNMNRNLKRSLKKSESFNLEYFSESNPSKDLISDWYNNILTKRFSDIGAMCPSEKIFHDMVKFLGNTETLKFSYVLSDGELVSGGFFLYGWCQDIYLRASKTESLSKGASVFLDYMSMKEGLSKSVKSWNFQSSPSKESNAYKYKQQWQCLEENNYYIVKIISNESVFIDAGIERVKQDFPYFFILPFYKYSGEK